MLTVARILSEMVLVPDRCSSLKRKTIVAAANIIKDDLTWHNTVKITNDYGSCGIYRETV